MNDPLLYDAIVEGLRILFLLAVPVVVALSLTGTVVSALQAVTSINEPALGYGLKLLALVVVLYVMLPSVTQSLVSFSQLVFR